MKTLLPSALILGLILAGPLARAAESPAGAAPKAPAPAAASQAPAASHPLEGTWKAEFDSQVGVQTYTYEFKVVGGKVTGTAEGNLNGPKSEIAEGKVTGDEVTFVEHATFGDMELKITYVGKLKGDEIAFTRNVADLAEETLVAKRSKPAAAPAASAPVGK